MFNDFIDQNRDLIRTIFSEDGVIILIIPFVALILLLSYSLLIRLQKQQASNDSLIKKLTPARVSIVVSFIVFAVVLPFSFSRIVNLENEVDSLEEEILLLEIHNPYEREDHYWGNPEAKYVYENYYIFFGGYMTGTRTIRITYNTPQELIDYLDDNNAKYVFVNYSHNDAITLVNKLARETYEANVLSGIGYGNDKYLMEITISDRDYDLSPYQQYIDDEVFVVTYGGPYELM